MLNKTMTLGLIVINLICFLVAIRTIGDSGYSNMVNSLSIGFIVSSIFYLLVVHIPEYKRRKMLNEILNEQYDEFKVSCIEIFLLLSDSQEYSNVEALLDMSEFRRYFKNENKYGVNRWDSIANSLLENEYYLKEIIYYIQTFNEEIKYVKYSIGLNEREVSVFLNRLSHLIVRIELTEKNYDDIKTLCSFLWSIFTGWSWSQGYSKTDYIRDNLRRAK